VLVLRVYRQGSSAPLPPFLKPLLGGTANLRGFKAGTDVGDNLLSGTAEVLVPVSSPLRTVKTGISVFTDMGAAWDKGERLSDQELLHGYGAGVWFSLAFVRASVSVAHGAGSGTRVHLGGAVAF
jgi:hemolysin activation/secretion protein